MLGHAAITFTSQIGLFLSLAALGIAFKTSIRNSVTRELSALDDQSARAKARRNLLLAAVAAFGVVLCALSTFGLPAWTAVLGGLAAGAVAPVVVHRRARKKYAERFDAALGESLQTVASSLRAGLTLRDSLAVAADNCAPAFAEEVAAALKEYYFGVPIEEALDNVRQRVNTPNCNIAFGAMIISSQLGGNLPAMLRQIVATIRERQRVEGKLKALTAQGRAQALLLCSAPPLLGIGMYLYDPSKMSLLTDYWVGQILLCLAILLEVVGIFVTSQVMKLEV
jgi:Flp pilus assembly protein TadB